MNPSVVSTPHQAVLTTQHCTILTAMKLVQVSTDKYITNYVSSFLTLSLRFNDHFPGEPGLAVFIEAKDDGDGTGLLEL